MGTDGVFLLLRDYAFISMLATAASFGVNQGYLAAVAPTGSTPPTSMTALQTMLLAYGLTYLSSTFRKGGYRSSWFQRLSVWQWLSDGDKGVAFQGRITLSAGIKLEPRRQYIFAAFPHGAMTVQHLLTMTDAQGMLSTVHLGDRRDLAASVLFLIPVVREILLLLGNVDAGAKTAAFNLKKNRSLLIFVGGEKEQLLTREYEAKVYLRERYGFIKLAMEFGTPLVPMYAFGENEMYHLSDFLLPARKLLQKHLHIGLPLCCGDLFWLPGWPRHRPLDVCIGAPIEVPLVARENQTREAVEAVQGTFIAALEALFEREKARHGVPPETKLQVL